MRSKKNRIEIAREIILQTFSFLETEGYISNSKIPSDSTSIETIDTEYVNVPKCRKIIISYSMGEFRSEFVHAFHLSIVRMPYVDPMEDYFSLSNYLRSLKKDYDYRMINHFDDDEASKIVSRIAESLRVYAWDIVKGDRWMKGYYPSWD